MDGGALARIFISYSRLDSQFVDRLEADLRSRSFDPWVDRRKLEGGQDWQDELQRAIDECQVVCVVLTPAALGSDAVKMEYRYAQRRRKPLIPLMLTYCELPMDLEAVQWVDFQNIYEDGLRNLVAALSRLDHTGESLWQAASLRDLYARGLDAERQGNLEQAATLYSQIHDKEPGYLNGIVASKRESLNERLYSERSNRLWKDAKRYRRAGEYSREVGALRALIGLGPKDTQAEERLPIAVQNRQNADLYDVAQELISLGDLDTAREQLALLWRNAPYYEDPAGIAPTVGMTAPPSYEEAKERVDLDVSQTIWKQEAQSERDAKLEAAKSELGAEISAIKRAIERTSTSALASSLVRPDFHLFVPLDSRPRKISISDAEARLRSLEGVLSDSSRNLWRTYAEYQSEAFYARDMMQWAHESGGRLRVSKSDKTFQMLASATQIVCALIGVWAGAFVYGVRWFHSMGIGANLEMALGGVIGGIIGLLSSFPMILVLAALIKSVLVIAGALTENRYAKQYSALKADADAAYARWLQQFSADNDARLLELENVRDQRLLEIDRVYQQRIDEINERYQLDMAGIAGRYQPKQE